MNQYEESTVSRLNRDEFVVAVMGMTYRGGQEEALAGAWFDLVTASGSRGLVEALLAGSEASCRTVPTSTVIYRGAASTACVPDEVLLWTRNNGLNKFLVVSPISSKSLRETAIPKVHSQDSQAKNLIRDILKGFSRKDPTSVGGIWAYPESSACILTIKDESTRESTTYFGSCCHGSLATFKFNVTSMTTAQLADFYVHRIIQVTSWSWPLAFEEVGLLDGAPPGVDWKYTRGGVAADLGPRVRVCIQRPYSDIFVDDLYHHSYSTLSLLNAIQDLYGEVSRYMTRVLVTEVEEDVFRSIVDSLPADLVESMRRMADDDADYLTSNLRETEERHVKQVATIRKLLQKAEDVRKILSGSP